MARQYIRTCQACGHEQVGRDPTTLKGGPTDSWRNTLCKKCKSEALDWGSYRCGEECGEDCEEHGCVNLR